MLNKKTGQSDNLLLYILAALAVILTLTLTAQTYVLHVILPLIKAVYLVLVNVCLGFFLLFCFNKKNDDSQNETIPFFTAFVTGLIVTFGYFYLVSFFKLLSTSTITLYYLLPLPVLLVVKRSGGTGFAGMFKTFFKRPPVEYLVFLFPLIFASLPSTFYDTLAYHLGIPNLYLQNGGFTGAEQLFYANTSVYYEISLIPAIFPDDLTPRLFHFLMGSLLILSAVDFGVEFLKIKKRFFLLLTLISMPMTVFLLTAVKNDLASAVFILPGIYWMLKKRPYLSALFWGFSLGVKYTNIIPLGFFLVFYFFKTGDKKTFIKQAVVFGLIAAAVLTPLMIKNYRFTGNPVFPFFHDHFDNKLPYWDSSRFEVIERDAKKLFYSFSDVLKSPLTISFEELGSGGIAGPMFLMFLPFLFFSKRRKDLRLWLLGFAALTLLVGGNFKLSTRVWFISFIFFSMYVAAALEDAPQKLKHALLTLFFIAAGFNIINSLGLNEYLFRSFNLYSGNLSVEEYKSRAFATYPAIAYVNENTPPDSRILLVGEAKSFYLKRPYKVSSGYDYSILRKYLEKSATVTEFQNALKSGGIDYLILNLNEYRRLHLGYNRLGEQEFKKSLNFLKQFPPIYKKGSLFIFEIK